MTTPTKTHHAYTRTLVAALAFFGATTAATAQAKPFKAVYSGTFVADFSGAPALVRLTIDGDGHSTHLGRSTVHGDSTLTFINRFCLQITSDFVVVEGASGAQLNLSNEGVDCATSETTIHGSGTMTVLGGTDRFVGYTGTGTWTVDADLQDGTFTLTFDGTLTKP